MTDPSLLGPQIAVDPGTTKVMGQETIVNAQEGNYPVLAQEAGVEVGEFNNIMKQLVDVESRGGDYTAENPKSGAYGKYQFTTRGKNPTAPAYAKKIGLTDKQYKDGVWKIPEKQEKMFQMFTSDNISSLKNRGVPITALNLYGAHQQGAKGISEILGTKKLSNIRKSKIRSNTSGLKVTSTDKEHRDAWINRWGPEFA